SSTVAYRVYANSLNEVAASFGNNCANAGATVDNDLSLELPTGVVFTSASWEVCFTPRGIADQYLPIDLYADGETQQVEVFMGGAVRIND
ncbi:MAG: hypothetical protein KDD44_12805, partial [Bdellovibrionales bacterium]|nr:hypothetical protein [Bdellovibrionales bacterium]